MPERLVGSRKRLVPELHILGEAMAALLLLVREPLRVREVEGAKPLFGFLERSRILLLRRPLVLREVALALGKLGLHLLERLSHHIEAPQKLLLVGKHRFELLLA